MSKKRITIGVANEKEKSFDVEELEKWVPTNVSHFSDTVYFKHVDTCYSMLKVDFDKLFNTK